MVKPIKSLFLFNVYLSYYSDKIYRLFCSVLFSVITCYLGISLAGRKKSKHTRLGKKKKKRYGSMTKGIFKDLMSSVFASFEG